MRTLLSFLTLLTAQAVVRADYDNLDSYYLYKSGDLYRLHDDRYFTSNRWKHVSGNNAQPPEISFFRAAENPIYEEKRFGRLEVMGFEKQITICENPSGSTYFSSSNHCNGGWYKSDIWVSETAYQQLQKINYITCNSGGEKTTRVYTGTIAGVQCDIVEQGSFYAKSGHLACGLPSTNKTPNPQTTYHYSSYRGGLPDSLTITCAHGYRVQDELSIEINCNSNGRLERNPAACRVVTCPPPKLPERARLPVRSNLDEQEGVFRYEDYFPIECIDGYKIQPENAGIYCDSEGEWSKLQANCQEIRCPRKSAPENGAVRMTDGTHYNSIAKFTCNSGYLLDDETEAICSKDGRWSIRTPVCHRIRCTSPGTPANGARSATDLGSGTSVTFSCNRGYLLDGQRTLNCVESTSGKLAVWDKEVPSCIPIMCDPIKTPVNGHAMSSSTAFGAQIMFSCNSGYSMEGPQVIVCRVGGWDQQPPVCNIRVCRNPGQPENGRLIGNDFAYDKSVSFECNSGHRLYGSKQIVCTESGRWSGNVPECEPINCPQITQLHNGMIKAESFSVGSVVKFSCFPGYYLQGQNSSTCLENGKWTSNIPYCAVCPSGTFRVSGSDNECIPCPTNSGTDGIGSHDSKLCRCNEGYVMIEGGECIEITCPTFAEPAHATFIPNLVHWKLWNVVRFHCNAGYVIKSGSSFLTCTEKGWSAEIPTCQACPSNTYSPTPGSNACLPCPIHSHVPEGSLGIARQACICDKGFKLSETGVCVDINECASGVSGCSDGCINDFGSYRCICNVPGNELASDGKTCKTVSTCPELNQTVRNGKLECTEHKQTNSRRCFAKCNDGFSFVSTRSYNTWLECSEGSNFRWPNRQFPQCYTLKYSRIAFPVSFQVSSTQDNLCGGHLDKTPLVSAVEQHCGESCFLKGLNETDCMAKEGGSQIDVSASLQFPWGTGGAVPADCDITCQRQQFLTLARAAYATTKNFNGTKLPFSYEVQGSISEAQASHFNFSSGGIVCPPGHITTRSRLCAACEAGNYYNVIKKDCVACPKNQYQDETGASRCKKCPSGTVTLRVEADSQEDCQAPDDI